jgi:hypothetical protein
LHGVIGVYNYKLWTHPYFLDIRGVILLNSFMSMPRIAEDGRKTRDTS